jgi:hypothetical protein
MQASPMEGDNKSNDHKNIKWRSAYNLCHLHSNQPGSGKAYGEFVRSYQIMLCNYKAFNFDNDLVERFLLRNEKGMELCEAVMSVFIDLTKANSIAQMPISDMSDMDCWVVFFALGNDPKYSGVIAEVIKKKEGIAVAFEALQNISQNADQRARFHSRRKWQQDR